MLELSDIVRLWNNFFFVPESALSVAILRIGMGLLIATNIVVLWRNANMWFGYDGIVHYVDFKKNFAPHFFSFLRFIPPDIKYVHCFLFITLVASVFMIIGLYTRVATVLVFAFTISLDHRNPYITYGANLVKRVLLFLLIFSNAESALSIDAYMKYGSINPVGLMLPPWCTRLIQLQVGVIYWRTFFWKISGKTWRDGTAVFYALHGGFRRNVLTKINDSIVFSKVATRAVLTIEGMMFPLLLIKQTRIVAIILAVLLHVALDTLMDLEIFGVTMVVSMLIWVPPIYFEVGLKYIHLI
jgi:hypothetical protein